MRKIMILWSFWFLDHFRNQEMVAIIQLLNRIIVWWSYIVIFLNFMIVLIYRSYYDLHFWCVELDFAVWRSLCSTGLSDCIRFKNKREHNFLLSVSVIWNFSWGDSANQSALNSLGILIQDRQAKIGDEKNIKKMLHSFLGPFSKITISPSKTQNKILQCWKSIKWWKIYARGNPLSPPSFAISALIL